VEISSGAQLTGPRPFSYLVFGARRFLIGYGPVLILAAIGCVEVFRERARPKADLVTGMVLWVVVGAIAFLIQGWPEYKWSLFTVPVGILGVTGVEALVRVTPPLRVRARLLLATLAAAVAVMSLAIATSPRIQTLLLASILVGASAGIAALILVHGAGARRVALWVLLAMLAISAGAAAVAPIRKADVLAEHDFAASVEARAELRRSLNQAYLAADRDLEALRRDGAVPGPIYVFGDPIVIRVPTVRRALRSPGGDRSSWIPGHGESYTGTCARGPLPTSSSMVTSGRSSRAATRRSCRSSGPRMRSRSSGRAAPGTGFVRADPSLIATAQVLSAYHGRPRPAAGCAG